MTDFNDLPEDIELVGNVMVYYWRSYMNNIIMVNIVSPYGEFNMPETVFLSLSTDYISYTNRKYDILFNEDSILYGTASFWWTLNAYRYLCLYS